MRRPPARRQARGGPGPEEAFIRAFTRSAPGSGRGVALGVGDDAALLRLGPGEELVATVDAVVEGVHFDGSFSPAEVGWKSLAVNLSDLAAMGARPLWALCALATPRDLPRPRLLGVGRGLAACARAHEVALVGGNVSRASELSVTVTALGAVPAGRALRRDGGRPGHRVLVSGRLGGAALGRCPGAPRALVRRQRRPLPRVALGLALRGLASAALDVSDGFLQDLGRLCRASGTGALIEAARLPLEGSPRASRSTPGGAGADRGEAGLSPELLAALSGGEDYELLLAVPAARVGAALAAAAAVGVPLTPVGELSRSPGVRVVDGEGHALPQVGGGYDHLA